MKWAKGWMGLVVAAGLVMGGASAAIAETETVDGVEWSYSFDGENVTVTGADPAEGELAIPSSLGNCPVASIGARAFYKCRGLTSVTISDSVTSIGDEAFFGCSGLTSVTIGNGVTSIGYDAFSRCRLLTAVCIHDLAAWCGISFQNFDSNPLVYANAGHLYLDGKEVVNLVIPDSVTSIGEWAFRGCIGLTSVTIPDSVTDIGYEAFCDCHELPDIVIGNGVTNIGDWAFHNCGNLTSVTIPDSVASIGEQAFRGCSRLALVVIGKGVKSIGYMAFPCTSLTAVYISDLAAWCGIAFGDSWCSNPLYYAQHLYLHGAEVEGALVIPDGVTSIGNSTFYHCTNLTSLTIPDGVESIGDRAFYQCVNLATVTMPDSVTSIGLEAFLDCTNLTAVYISDLAAWCGIVFGDLGCSNPLYYAKHLYLQGEELSGELLIPEGVTSIGNGALEYCTNLMSVTIPDSVTSIGGLAFYQCSELQSVVLGSGVTSIGYGAFRNCSKLTAVTIPNGVTCIEGDTFYQCSRLTDVVLGNDVTNIGESAFAKCTNLTAVVIPDSVKSIERSVFMWSGLTNAVIGIGVTNIGANSFIYCDSLQTIYVPASWKTNYVEYYDFNFGHNRTSFWSEYAGVPSGCEIIYFETETSSVPVAVPYRWLETNAVEILAAHDGDYEEAAKAEAANGMPVWECYLAGLSPMDAAAEFKVKSIAFEDGQAVVKWEPDLNEDGTKEERLYEVEGAETLEGAWGPTNAASRFFRVKVALP